MRIGHGFDVHRFSEQKTENAFITVGGVKIACDRELMAHSDGDVLIHALCDALLGAAGLGDIGQHFPDTDAQYENIDSRILLDRVIGSIANAGWEVVNMDATIIAQAPKMLPHKSKMQHYLADDLRCSREQINIKATTTEGLGFIGRNEGIACQVVALIKMREPSGGA